MNHHDFNSDPVDHKDDLQPTPSTERDRQNSLFNTLRGFEEFMLDATGKIISSNLEAITITGYEEWEIIGKHFSIFYTDHDIEMKQPEVDLKRVEDEDHFVYFAWRVKKRKTNFWAKVKFYSVKDSLGTLCAYRMVMQDATHKAIYNFRVKRIKDEYLNLFSNAFIGIFKFGMDDFEVQLFNEKATTITGHEFSDNLKFYHLFENQSDFDKLISQLETEKRVHGFEFQINKPDGVEAWATVSCRYFANSHFVQGILIDITERKSRLLELQRLNQELDKFIYHSSHDLRAPLTTMMGLLNLIGMAKANEPIDQYCDMLRERVGYMDALLKDLAAITFNSQSPVKLEGIQIKQEVASVIREFELAGCNVDFKYEVTDNSEFYCDVFRIQTILRNLISNSVKFSNHSSQPALLKITVSASPEILSISIEDNGRGIDDQHLAKIFEMFFRADDKTTGTGLGLYIVKSMLDKLGGMIKVKSAIGVGTSFTITIPNKV